MGAFGRHYSGYLGYRQYIPLGDALALNQSQRFRFQQYPAPRYRLALSVIFVAHVYHPRAAMFIEMS